jgi:hypothetical protein
MRKFSLLLLLAGFSAFFMVSCNNNNDDSNPPIYVFDVDAAAQYITTAFCINSGGINFHMENAARIADKLKSGLFDSAFQLKKTDTALVIRYMYDVQYNANYVASNPPKVQFTYTANGAFNSTFMSSDDTQNGNFTITGLDTASVHLVMNGTVTDGGNQHSDYYNNLDFISQFTFTPKNVEFDKQTFWITGGTGTIHINGFGPANIPFDFGGSITFTGLRIATLVLNGTTYQMNLVTGGMSK